MSLLPKPIVETEEFESAPTVGEMFEASYETAVSGETAVTALAERWAMQDAKKVVGAEMWSAEKVNDMFPRVGAKTPMNSGLAAFVDTELREQDTRDAKLNHRNASLLGKGAAFLGGLAAHATDVIEVGLGMATGFTSSVATAGATLTARQAAGIVIAENVFENLVTESVVYANAQEQQQEYTAEQFATNVIASSVVFTAASSGVKYAYKKYGRAVVGTVAEQADSALMNGKNPSFIVDSTLDAAKKELDDPNFNRAFRESFPELAGEDVSVREGFEIIQGKINKGELSDEALDAFNTKLDEVGFDRAKADYADPTENVKFSDDLAKEQAQYLSSRESDLGYVPELDKEWRELELKDIEPDETRIQQMQNSLAEAGDTATLEAVAKLGDIETKKLGAVESFFNCLLGG